MISLFLNIYQGSKNTSKVSIKKKKSTELIDDKSRIDKRDKLKI